MLDTISCVGFRPLMFVKVRGRVREHEGSKTQGRAEIREKSMDQIWSARGCGGGKSGLDSDGGEPQDQTQSSESSELGARSRTTSPRARRRPAGMPRLICKYLPSVTGRVRVSSKQDPSVPSARLSGCKRLKQFLSSCKWF